MQLKGPITFHSKPLVEAAFGMTDFERNITVRDLLFDLKARSLLIPWNDSTQTM